MHQLWCCALKSFCLYHLLISGSFKVPAYLDAPFKSNGKCPVVIFSHGLGAFRYIQSEHFYSIHLSWNLSSNWHDLGVFLGLCIQLYVQNWPLRASLWRPWNTGTCTKYFIKYTSSRYAIIMLMWRFILLDHITQIRLQFSSRPNDF